LNPRPQPVRLLYHEPIYLTVTERGKMFASL
jgi:hypothetical protein